MRFSPQQDDALRAVSRWLQEGDQQIFRLFGYAGTGKTTLAKHLAEGVSGTVLFGAFTGKAAHVLRTKGCPGASTIHSMIYHSKSRGEAMLKELEAELSQCRAELRAEYGPADTPEEQERLRAFIDGNKQVRELLRKIEDERNSLAKPSFTLNVESIVNDAELVVIDECSMVDDRIGEDLCYFRKKILVLGDPAQLPPFMGGGFFTDAKPDFMLTEIHRQAADNPIIAMATRVRQGEGLALGTYGDSRVTDQRPSPEEAQAADQVLVGRNKTRHASNRRMRQLLGHQEWHPIPGDRLVCLRNNHDKGLLNGAIWHVVDVGEVDTDRLTLTLDPEMDGSPTTVEAHACYFRGEEPPFWERKAAEEFDYGYALTVHKAQGSQWDDVILFDESWVFREDRSRWLYTGITRAAERVTVVRM